jgi:hypothetical protein
MEESILCRNKKAVFCRIPAGAPVEYSDNNKCYYVRPSNFTGILKHDATYHGCRVASDNVVDLHGYKINPTAAKVDINRMKMPRSGMERIYFSNGDMIYRTKSGVWGCQLNGRAAFSYCNAKSHLAAVSSYEDLTGNTVVNK